MAKSGRGSRLGPDRQTGVDTKQSLIEAAVTALKEDGFGGSSARAIARRADCNQALVFYHFGSVVQLLLAALDSVSTDRLDHYGHVLGGVASPTELVDAASRIFTQDLDAGHISVLVEMIAGSSSTPGLGSEVAQRIEPWKDFARQAVESGLAATPLGAVIPAAEVAHGIVALYLGLELLSHLEGERQPALDLFDLARRAVGLLAPLTAATSMSEQASPTRNPTAGRQVDQSSAPDGSTR